MDILNDYYPLYPGNPDTCNLSDSELSDLEEYRNVIRGRRNYSFDDYLVVYSDELWYMWCMIQEHTSWNILPFFNKINYYTFCHIVYDNSEE
jgi:hypothetical protein